MGGRGVQSLQLPVLITQWEPLEGGRRADELAGVGGRLCEEVRNWSRSGGLRLRCVAVSGCTRRAPHVLQLNAPGAIIRGDR
jgi:hypothetical protein